MNASMNTVMLEAARLTRAGQLLEATEIIQRTLHGAHEPQVAELRERRPRDADRGRLPRYRRRAGRDAGGCSRAAVSPTAPAQGGEP